MATRPQLPPGTCIWLVGCKMGGGGGADIGHMTPARAVARRQPDAP